MLSSVMLWLLFLNVFSFILLPGNESPLTILKSHKKVLTFKLAIANLNVGNKSKKRKIVQFLTLYILDFFFTKFSLGEFLEILEKIL